MTKVAFVVGHDCDAPEAYWRAVIPARALQADVLPLTFPGAEQRALRAGLVWIHHPSSLRAAALAEIAQGQGKVVIVDFSEDPWLRGDVAEPLRPVRLEAAERAIDAATLIIVAHPGLEASFAQYDRPIRVVEPIIPLRDGWDPQEEARPPILGWWSDGRQKSGFEIVAPALRAVMRRTDIRIHHYQFSHHSPLMVGKAEAGRLGAWSEGTGSAAVRMSSLRNRFAQTTISLDCYPAGRYCDSVSQLPLLRAAALGIPSITTRSEAPPGSISATPDEWEAVITEVLQDPGFRRGLSLEARAWAETHSSHAAYIAIIQEVLPCLSTT